MKINGTISILLACLAGVCLVSSQAAAGTLLGSVTQISPATPEYGATDDLTTEGTADWIFWEETVTMPSGLFDHKAAGPDTNSISDLSLYGAIGPWYQPDGGPNFSWSNGTPDASSTGTNNCFANGPAGNGLQFTVKADTRTKYLTVYFGGFDGIAACTATLSDNSAPPITLTVDDSGDYQAEDYATIQFAADSTNQTLTVAVYISVAGATDGSYTTVGLSAATLQIPPPAPVISVQPADQTNFFTLAAQFNVEAGGGLPLSYQWLEEENGVYVPLSDAGPISGSATSTLTISNLVDANATSYQVVVSNNWGAVTSSVAALTLFTQTSILIGSSAPAPAAVNLTAEGAVDWASWGYLSGTAPNYLEQKAGGTNEISDVTTYGDLASGPTQNSGAPEAASWSDGMPDLAATNSYTGIYWSGVNNGFQFSVAASTNAQILKVYVDAYSSKLHFEAALSGASAPAYVDESVTTLAYEDEALAYTIEFAADSPGQTLNILAYSLLNNGGGGNTELMSATLRGPEPYIAAQTTSLTNWDTQTVELTASAAGWLPLSYQWWTESNSVYVPLADAGQISGSGTAILAISNLVSADATNYYLVVTNSYGAITSSVINMTILPITGTMLGASVPTPPTADLTAAGTLDWAAWGELSGIPPNSFEQKAGGTNQISDVTVIGASSGPITFGNAIVACTWSDGTPDAAETNETDGIYFNGITNGYQITVPADTTKKILTFYAGGYNCQVQVQATLSDLSAPPYIDTSLVTAPGAALADAYTIEFAASTNNQTLTVTVTCATDGGNCTLMAATLADPIPNILAEPDSQTNNVATTATFTTLVEGAAPLSYQWWMETNGVYVPLADAGQISGSKTATLSISDLVFANATNYYVVVTNGYGAVTSSVASLTVLPVTGTLIGSAATAPGTVNLTVEGTLDWADWGVASGTGTNYLEQKAGGTNQISDVTAIGPGGGPDLFNNAVIEVSWSDGTPDAAITNTTTGIYYSGLGNGYKISVPADSSMKTLTVYAGGYSTIVNFQASLSDDSAPPYANESLSDPGGGSPGSADAYTLQFAAGSTNQTLTVEVTGAADFGAGNVTLIAATLSQPPATIQIGFVGSSLQLTWPSGTLEQSTNIAGPWTTNSAPSPFMVTPSGPQMFYRVKAN
jgi:hypothetical protein